MLESNALMKAILQRVTKASVSVDGEVVGRIGRGLVILVGVANGDTEEDVRYLAQKARELRIFADEAGKFNLSAIDVKGELLVISQFTLLADTKKGRRPSFVDAAPPELAERLFDQFVATVRESGLKVETGRFQQHMLVEIYNDGPVTIVLDSRNKLPHQSAETLNSKL
jgi:D-tyrosyl-tRNA(Tyr) deacylase